LIGERSGNSGPNGSVTGNESGPKTNLVYGKFDHNAAFESYNDTGSAARYFYQADWIYEVSEQINKSPYVYYQSKPKRAEKEAGLDRLNSKIKYRVNSGGLEDEPRFAPVEAKNIHPTVKPISLNIHLAKLLLPPSDYSPRRLLIPFLGSGSEMIAALLSGWNEVVGIERESEYVQIAEERVKWWAEKVAWGHKTVESVLKAASTFDIPEQMSLL
jgi:DNA modification methylase